MSTEGDWVDHVAVYIGASGAALRLLISLMMAYPMALVHRKFFYGRYLNIQHIFFIICGSYIGYFNYGWQLLHAFSCILIQYPVVWMTSGTLFSVVFAFIFQIRYLLTEYYFTESEKYDIKWTIPHCVLTLRLIGQAFDVYDDELSRDQKQQAIKRMPSLLESAGHVFHPSSFLIGPQYPIRRYSDFVDGKFHAEGNVPLSTTSPALRRLFLGLFYVVVYQIGIIYVNPNTFSTAMYKNCNLPLKMIVIGLNGKIALYKYVSCWIVAEGSCIYSGIAYNGKNENNKPLWNGCENIEIDRFETSYKFSHMVASFNKCTNAWIAQHVYKRLKFLGNRQISQSVALVFLAVWHGLHSGYYMCFFMEFLTMNAERQFESIMKKSDTIMRWHNSTTGYYIDMFVLKLFLMCYFGYCMIPFTLLKYDQWGPVYSDLYYNGLLIFGAFPVYAPLIKLVLGQYRRRPRPQPESSSGMEIRENGNNPPAATSTTDATNKLN